MILSVEKAKVFLIEANYPLLNKDQQQVLDYIKDLLLPKTGMCY